MNQYLIAILFLATSCPAMAQTSPSKSGNRDKSVYFSIADSNFVLYQLPDSFKKPENWQKADKERSESQIEWYGNSYPDTFDLQDALAIIDTAIEFLQLRSAKSWCLKNYQAVFPYLVARLSDKRKIGLTNTADLIIWDRLGTGDLQFYGHGGVISEDLFTIAGRASWILNQITGEDFASVHSNLTEEMAVNYKKLWLEYLDKLKK